MTKRLREILVIGGEPILEKPTMSSSNVRDLPCAGCSHPGSLHIIKEDRCIVGDKRFLSQEHSTEPECRCRHYAPKEDERDA